MSVSQKTQYALRALVELAGRGRGQPIKIGSIAAAQNIPPRFLEVILGELKQGGFVESRRGSSGGYMLRRSARQISVGDVIRHLEGPIGPVDCIDDPNAATCPAPNGCSLQSMFRRVRDAMASIYDTTTFADLADEQRRLSQEYVPNYVI